MDSFSKHLTHFIECVVGSNKAVSACKAHVEIPKVEGFTMRVGRKGERPPGHKTPRVSWSIFMQIGTRLSPMLPSFSFLPLLWVGSTFLHVGSVWHLLRWVGSWILALYGTFIVHAKGMKSAQGGEGIY